MKNALGVVWRRPVPDWQQQLEACVRKAADTHSFNTKIFFRADDIAVPGRQFERLLETFSRHHFPLALAVVPAWITAPRWRILSRMGKQCPDLWCWHQHGWRHQNHEPLGKKQEFGPSRSEKALHRDLDCGNSRLQAILGSAFVPIFTPPWNRCSKITLALLQEMGYKAVSRSRGNRPEAPPGLPDHVVHVDLHTDRAPTAIKGWQRLLENLAGGLRQPVCGIMIHHQRMNDAAFDFLDRLLENLTRHSRLRKTDLRDLPTR